MANLSIPLSEYFKYLSTGHCSLSNRDYNNQSGAVIQEYVKPDGHTSLCIHADISQLKSPLLPPEQEPTTRNRLLRLGFVSTYADFKDYRKHGKYVLWPRHRCNITINAYTHVLLKKLVNYHSNSTRGFEAWVSNEAIRNQLNFYSQNGVNPGQSFPPVQQGLPHVQYSPSMVVPPHPSYQHPQLSQSTSTMGYSTQQSSSLQQGTHYPPQHNIRATHSPVGGAMRHQQQHTRHMPYNHPAAQAHIVNRPQASSDLPHDWYQGDIIPAPPQGLVRQSSTPTPRFSNIPGLPDDWLDEF
ncbi:hypothetical protein Xmau_00251 [Xenorhabdus mauleonii]|uniref:Uncharacterized protein n=1 Tax=Xenorhabdus mauleonii TaxID=351675 RepID=A0A1I3MWY8_9GAMM|nr:hypothetical protein [Xenorhabdus mauleonii]PHM45860.1 hypothetical protein Xmau_00251 [Xenorhabdus mauleonii]SFJ01290.1 hypothetical protein SAMN05421680_1059 [Xenorhabdus mauleonii]